LKRLIISLQGFATIFPIKLRGERGERERGEREEREGGRERENGRKKEFVQQSIINK